MTRYSLCGTLYNLGNIALKDKSNIVSDMNKLSSHVKNHKTAFVVNTNLIPFHVKHEQITRPKAVKFFVTISLHTQPNSSVSPVSEILWAAV